MATPRIKAIEILTREEIDAVRRISPWRAAWGIAHAWIVIAAAMALFAWRPNPLTYLLAVAVIGARQLGLAILMHDGAHRLLFRNHRVNDFITQWFCAYPVLADVVPYRPYHLEHHKNTQEENDPDLILSAPFPITPMSLRRKIFRDLTGQTGIKLLLAGYRRSRKKKRAATVKGSINSSLASGGSYGSLIANAAIFAILLAVGHPWYFLSLWVVPWLTFFQLVTRIRNIAEHSVVPEQADDFHNTRTTLAGPIERAFVAPYCVNFHIEHHLFTFVPFYNLPKVHAILKRKGYAERMEIGHSYWSVLRKATSAA